MSSLSQEYLLPMPVQAADPRHATVPGMRLQLPGFLYDVSAGQYALLPTGANDCASDDGTLAGDEDGGSPKAKYAHAIPKLESLHGPVQVPVRGSSPTRTISWSRALANTLWYIRMYLLLALLCSAATLATSTLFAVVGNLLFLGALAPYAAMLQNGWGNEWRAGAVGAGVLGCAVATGAFVCLVVRRFGSGFGSGTSSGADSRTQMEMEMEDEYEYEHLVAGTHRAKKEKAGADSDSDEPEELWAALLVAALAGVFAMAVGMAVVPALRLAVAVDIDAEGQRIETGFGVRHALAVGAWGLGAPLVPVAACMVVMTLWRCDPCAGAECCCEGVGACCERD